MKHCFMQVATTYVLRSPQRRLIDLSRDSYAGQRRRIAPMPWPGAVLPKCNGSELGTAAMTDLTTPYAFFFGQAFTIAEVAEKLGISPRQVLNHITDGTLVAINVGRGATRKDVRVTDEALDAFVEDRAVAAPQLKVRAKLSHPRNKPAIA